MAHRISLILIFLLLSLLVTSTINTKYLASDEIWFAKNGMHIIRNTFSHKKEDITRTSYPPLVMAIRAAPFYYFEKHSLPKIFRLSKPSAYFPYRNRTHPNGVAKTIESSEIFLYLVRHTIVWFRMPSLLFWLLLLGVSYQWAKSLFGPTAALITVFLLSFEPNLIAHSSLDTADFGCVALMCLALYYFYRFLEKNGIIPVILAAITLGYALASKYYAIELILIYLVLSLTWIMVKKLNFKQALLILGSYLFIVISALVFLSIIYTAFKAFPLNAPHPLLFPYNYIHGFHHRINAAHYGHIDAPYLYFLMGQYSTTGWWYYFILVFFIKTPLALLIFLVLAFIRCVQRKAEPLSNWVLIIPVLIHLLLILFFNQINVGIRHLLFIYPLLIIWVSQLFENSRNKLFIACMTVFLSWYMFDTVMINPNNIAYFNEITAGPKNGYKYLADSNIDYGQDEILIHEYLKSEQNKGEAVIVNPAGPATGRIAVNVNFLYGITDKISRYQWLRDKYQPVGTVGYSWILYNIPHAQKIKPAEAVK